MAEIGTVACAACHLQGKEATGSWTGGHPAGRLKKPTLAQWRSKLLKVCLSKQAVFAQLLGPGGQVLAAVKGLGPLSLSFAIPAAIVNNICKDVPCLEALTRTHASWFNAFNCSQQAGVNILEDKSAPTFPGTPQLLLLKSRLPQIYPVLWGFATMIPELDK